MDPITITTRLFGKVMQWKRKGELAAIEAIRASSGQTTYTIVRPGGLSDKKEPMGLSAGLRISQGDVVGGIITRDDTALVCVEALRSDTARDTVFELVTWKDGTEPAAAPADWMAFFRKLQPNDGAHAPGFYPEEAPVTQEAAAVAEPATAKTDL